MRRRRIGLEEDRLIEQRACGTRSSLREIGVAEPDEGCDIVRPDLKRFLKRRDRLFERTFRFVEMPKIVGPPRVGRRERLRVEVAGFGGTEIRRGHQKLSQFAVRGAEAGIAAGCVLDLAGQRRVSSAHLVANGVLHRGEIGHRDRLQSRATGGLVRS